MMQQFYCWADQVLVLTCADPDQAHQIATLWQGFLLVQPTVPAPHASATVLRFGAPADLVRPALLTALYRDTHTALWRTPDGYCLQAGATWLALTQGEAYGVLDAGFWSLPLPVQREFFQRGLLLLLRGHGYYGLHANGIVDRGGGLLFIGRSGSGKTTLALSLIAAGRHYLGDDVVCLQQRAEGVVAHAFQRGFACTEATLDRFPALQAAVIRSLDPQRRKHQVDLGVVAPGQLATAAPPRALLFPTICDQPVSCVTPLTTAETLFRLAEQSNGLFVERAVAAQQLTVLRNLAQQAPGYRLALGRDLNHEPAAVVPLLENLY